MTRERGSAPAPILSPAPALAERSASDTARVCPVDSFSILGRRFNSHARTTELREWLERHWRYNEHESDAHPYRIRLTEEAGPVNGAAAGGGEWIESRLPGRVALRWYTRDGEWYTGDEAAGVRASIGVGESRIAVWGTTNDPPAGAPAQARALPPAPWPALYVALCEALRGSGLMPLHAAVIVRGGRAIALTAPSGTGKTTTLLRLLERGWRPLAEDLSWLDPTSCTLYGWDRGIRLWPDGLARVGPRFAAAPWTIDRDGKRSLDWTAVTEARTPQAKLTRIVLLERDAARPSSIVSLSRRAAVRVLWEATGVPFTPQVRQHAARHIAYIVQTVELVRLTLGTTGLPEPDIVR